MCGQRDPARTPQNPFSNHGGLTSMIFIVAQIMHEIESHCKKYFSYSQATPFG
jgi:hypothetical protein